MKPLVYVSGPYSADPVNNTRAATLVGQSLWRTGKVAVVVPHWSLIGDAVSPMPVADWYAFDLDLLAHCHAVLRLPGESAGADAEVERAGELGLPVFDAVAAVVEWAGEWEPMGVGEVDRLVADLGRLRKDMAEHRAEWDARLDTLAAQNEVLLSIARKAQADHDRREALERILDGDTHEPKPWLDLTSDEAAVWDALIKAAW